MMEYRTPKNNNHYKSVYSSNNNDNNVNNRSLLIRQTPMLSFQAPVSIGKAALTPIPIIRARPNVAESIPLSLAYEYIDVYLNEAEIDFNLYQFTQRPILPSFIRLVSICFSAISNKTMLLNERVTMDDLWRKLNQHFELLSFNSRLHRQDLKVIGQNEHATENIMITFGLFIHKRMHPIMNCIKEVKQSINHKHSQPSAALRFPAKSDFDETDDDNNNNQVSDYPELEFFQIVDIRSAHLEKLCEIDERIDKNFNYLKNELLNIEKSIWNHENNFASLQSDIASIQNQLDILEMQTDSIDFDDGGSNTLTNLINKQYINCPKYFIQMKNDFIDIFMSKIRNKFNEFSLIQSDCNTDHIFEMIQQILNNDHNDDQENDLEQNINSSSNELIQIYSCKFQQSQIKLKRLTPADNGDSGQNLDESNDKKTAVKRTYQSTSRKANKDTKSSAKKTTKKSTKK